MEPHTRDGLYVVISGRGEFVHGDRRAPFGSGDLIFVPAGSEMLAVLVAIAILTASACDRSMPPAEAPPPSATPGADSATDMSAAPMPSFTDRVWLRADAGSAPGAMQVYLSDGTLIADSCFETYRLSSWRLEGGEELVWSEDGTDIRARLVSVDADALVLRVMLRGGEEEQRFSAATVPYVCPDMPR